MPPDDYYALLGVSPSASPDELKRRFRFLSHAYHPDKFATADHRRVAEEEFKRISAAYKCLAHPATRASYDKQHQAYFGTSRSSKTPPNPLGGNSPWPSLSTVNVVRCDRASGNPQSPDETIRTWQGYHAEACVRIGDQPIDLPILASQIVSFVRSQRLPGTLHWDSSFPPSPDGFGLVLLQQLHHRLHLSSRITCHVNGNGVDSVITQDVIRFSSVHPIFVGTMDLVCGFGVLLLFFATVGLVLLFISPMEDLVYGNPKRVIALQPTFTVTRLALVRILAGL